MINSISGTRHYCYQQRDKLIAAGYQCDRLKRLGREGDWYILTFHKEDTND